MQISSLAETKLENVTPKIIKTADLVKDIAYSGKEQISGIELINNSMEQLNTVTQKNVTSSEQLASNAEQLLAQSGYLLKSISFFKTVNTNNEKAI